MHEWKNIAVNINKACFVFPACVFVLFHNNKERWMTHSFPQGGRNIWNNSRLFWLVTVTHNTPIYKLSVSFFWITLSQVKLATEESWSTAVLRAYSQVVPSDERPARFPKPFPYLRPISAIFFYPICDLLEPWMNSLFHTCLIISSLVQNDVKGIVKVFCWWSYK